MPTTWTEQTLDATGWDSNNYPPGTSFVLIAGVVQPVDADGSPVSVLDATAWTERTMTATTLTENTLSVATSWTEATG